MIETHAPATLEQTLANACEKALGYHVQGELDLAEQVYRAILGADPRHTTANYALGMLLLQGRQTRAALQHLEAAIGLAPGNVDYWTGYIEALIADEQKDKAAQIIRVAEAYGLDAPTSAELASRLNHHLPPQVSGGALIKPAKSGKPAQRRANPVTAKESFASRLSRLPAKAQLKKADDLVATGRLTEALRLARDLITDFPTHGMGWKMLGVIQAAQEGTRPSDHTLDALRHAADLMPDDAEASFNYFHALIRAKRTGMLRERLEKFVGLHPDHPMTLGLLGMCILTDGNDPERAMNMLQRSIDTDRSNAALYSSWLFGKLEAANPDPVDILDAHKAYDRRYCENLVSQWPRHNNDRNPERALRIGLVSGDMYDHSVAVFVEPILAAFAQRTDYRFHVYYNNLVVDEVTTRLKGLVPCWRDVRALSDRQLADRIREDQIDILIDLASHTAENRLLVFARKPAPIQVTWIGYPGTTGMRAMDYIFADPYFLPPGRFDDQFTEKIVWLPAADPVKPPAHAPAINVLPALRNGHMTFASMNRLSKITRETVAAWGALLRALPDARLIMGHLPPAGIPDRITQAFREEGICSERIVCRQKMSMPEYLAMHSEIDLYLDSFPYNGGTTVHLGLWMGVPTLTVAGITPAGHQATAGLRKVGLGAFVADTPAQLVDRGLYWAGHLDELNTIRLGLRDRIIHSPNRQMANILVGLDTAFRTIWRRWCADQAPQGFLVPTTATPPEQTATSD